jgi:hypothetical protein
MLIRVPVIETKVTSLAEPTVVEIWSLKDGWEEVGKVNELFRERAIGAPMTSE